MMRTIAIVMAAAAGALMAPAAQAAENIACVETGYTAATQREIDRYVSNFSIDGYWERDVPEPLNTQLIERALQCAEKHGWSKDAAFEAFTYQLAKLDGQGIEGVAAIKPAQWAKVRAAYRATDVGTIDLLRHVFNGATKTPFEEKAADGAVRTLGAKAGVPAGDITFELLATWVAMQILRADALQRFTTK